MKSASAQKCGGVHMKISANISTASSADADPVAAAQPIIGGKAPAAPPMTMFCGVERFSHIE
jgi:hypothetical protein